jgi:hypothetical protein
MTTERDDNEFQMAAYGHPPIIAHRHGLEYEESKRISAAVRSGLNRNTRELAADMMDLYQRLELARSLRDQVQSRCLMESLAQIVTDFVEFAGWLEQQLPDRQNIPFSVRELNSRLRLLHRLMKETIAALNQTLFHDPTETAALIVDLQLLNRKYHGVLVSCPDKGAARPPNGIPPVDWYVRFVERDRGTRITCQNCTKETPSSWAYCVNCLKPLEPR